MTLHHQNCSQKRKTGWDRKICVYPQAADHRLDLLKALVTTKIAYLSFFTWGAYLATHRASLLTVSAALHTGRLLLPRVFWKAEKWEEMEVRKRVDGAGINITILLPLFPHTGEWEFVYVHVIFLLEYKFKVIFWVFRSCLFWIMIFCTRSHVVTTVISRLWLAGTIAQWAKNKWDVVMMSFNLIKTRNSVKTLFCVHCRTFSKGDFNECVFPLSEHTPVWVHFSVKTTCRNLKNFSSEILNICLM